MDFLAIILGMARKSWEAFSISWWIIVPLGLFFVWKDLWLEGLNLLWRRKIKWILLELKIPGNVLKTPKAMENVFSALHAIWFKAVGFEDRWFKGEELFWFTCELVGYNGGVSFYIRCPAAFRNLVESAFYSEYPDAEIVEAEDYTELMPDVLPNAVYDLWGNDWALAKPNPYPIRTYQFFEAHVDEQRLDPIAAITEVMSRLREGEAIWLQYLIRPIPDSWKKEGEEIRDRMMERKKSEPKGWLESLFSGAGQFIRNFAMAGVEYPNWDAKDDKKEEKLKFVNLSPGERNVLEAIENKISKLGFETAIRFIYIDRADTFTQANVAAVNGAIKQFNTQDMNSFKRISGTDTFITSRKLTHKSWFRKSKLYYRKRSIYDLYRLRWFPPKYSILNTEELATIFHFPLVTVEAPLLRRLGTRKGEPPINLPVE